MVRAKPVKMILLLLLEDETNMLVRLRLLIVFQQVNVPSLQLVIHERCLLRLVLPLHIWLTEDLCQGLVEDALEALNFVC